MPKVSVILTTRDRAGMIGGAIRSILKQTFEDFELLIMDDASNDDTFGVMRSFTDPRILYVRQPYPKGSAENWDEGLRRCRGDYIHQMHDDDLALPTLLAQEVAMLDTHPKMQMVGTNVLIMDEAGNVTQERFDEGREDRIFEKGEFITEYMVNRFTFKCPTQMTRRRGTPEVEAAKSRLVGVTPDHIGSSGDLFNIFRANTYGQVGYLAYPLLRYRVHSGGESFNADVIKSDLALHQGALNLCKQGGMPQCIPYVEASMLRHQILQEITQGKKPTEMLRKLGEIEHAHPKPYSMPVFPDGRARSLKGKTAVIVGSFLNAYLLAEECLHSGVKLKYFVDDNIRRQHHRLDGLMIQPPEWLKAHPVDVVLISNERRPKEMVEPRIRPYTNAPIYSWKELKP